MWVVNGPARAKPGSPGGSVGCLGGHFGVPWGSFRVLRGSHVVSNDPGRIYIMHVLKGPNVRYKRPWSFVMDARQPASIV